SILLANKIEEQFQEIADRKSRGVKQAGFVVLRLTTMPSVLVEAGFLSNKEEESFLYSENGQHLMAKALFTAFSEYKHEMDRIAAPELDVAPAPKRNVPVESTAKKIEPSSPKIEKVETTKVEANAITEQEVWIPEPMIRPTDDLVEYRVQLSASITPLDTKIGAWRRVENLVQVWELNRYKYLVTGFPDYNSAMKGQNYWRVNGFPDAFIVGYQNGKRLEIQSSPNP
ncbi:MAG: N-acetylmuramoyl-L-alanine amidase, partial [Bacteroidota bacterium]